MLRKLVILKLMTSFIWHEARPVVHECNGDLTPTTIRFPVSEWPTSWGLAKDESPFFRATIEPCQTAEPNQSSTGGTR